MQKHFTQYCSTKETIICFYDLVNVIRKFLWLSSSRQFSLFPQWKTFYKVFLENSDRNHKGHHNTFLLPLPPDTWWSPFPPLPSPLSPVHNIAWWPSCHGSPHHSVAAADSTAGTGAGGFPGFLPSGWGFLIGGQTHKASPGLDFFRCSAAWSSSKQKSNTSIQSWELL